MEGDKDSQWEIDGNQSQVLIAPTLGVGADPAGFASDKALGDKGIFSTHH